MCGLFVAAGCLFAVANTAASQDTAAIRLLPTAREAARVRALADAFDNPRTDDAGASNQLKAIVQDFVIRQLNGAPAIADTSLREQLRKVLGITTADRSDAGLYVS